MLKLFTNDPEFSARLAGKEACICPVLRFLGVRRPGGRAPSEKSSPLLLKSPHPTMKKSERISWRRSFAQFFNREGRGDLNTFRFHTGGLQFFLSVEAKPAGFTLKLLYHP